MKSLIMILTLIATAFVFVSGCGKKEEAAVPAGCGALNVMSPVYGCLPRGQCPRGFGVSPTQPSMCVDVNTGDSAMTQQCGAGFVLTAHGCYQQGPCQPGQALVNEVCKPVAQGNGSFIQQPYYQNNGFGRNPWGAMSPYGGINPYGYYRGF
jgi:hypothetical protein